MLNDHPRRLEFEIDQRYLVGAALAGGGGAALEADAAGAAIFVTCEAMTCQFPFRFA